MSGANALSGKNGKFVVGSSLVACTTQWSVNPTLDTQDEWGDSCSAGFTNVVPGRKGATFDAEGKYQTNDEVFDLFQPGDTAIGVLWLDASSLYWDFPRAVNTDFNMTVNIDTGEVVGWTSSWKADGVFYYPGEAGATSRTLPA